MNKFCKADEGKSAIFTDSDGTTRSVKLKTVSDNAVLIYWRLSPTAVRFQWVRQIEWHNLNLFPAGASFVTI